MSSAGSTSLAGSGSLCDLRRAQTASNRTVLAGNPAMGLTLTLWALLATLAAAQDFCPKPGQRCRVAQDIVIVVDVHDVLNSHLQSFIELLQLESTDSRVALVKVGERPWDGNCNIPINCASVVGAGFSRDTATLTSRMALLSSGDAACPSCGLEVALQILQSGSGYAGGGRAGVASVIMLVSTPANVYYNGPLEEDPMFIAAATAGDTRVRPPRQPLRPHPFAAATTLDCSHPPPLLTHPPHAITD